MQSAQRAAILATSKLLLVQMHWGRKAVLITVNVASEMDVTPVAGLVDGPSDGLALTRRGGVAAVKVRRWCGQRGRMTQRPGRDSLQSTG